MKIEGRTLTPLFNNLCGADCILWFYSLHILDNSPQA